MRKDRINYQSGQTLLEIMIAFAVVSMILVVLVSKAAESVRNTSYARNQIKAARYAQGGIEWAREQRDRMGWINFEDEINDYANPVTFCVLEFTDVLEDLSFGSCAAGNFISGTIFNREIIFDLEDPDASDEDRVDVIVDVNWTDSIGGHQVIYTTKLSEWYE